MLDSKKRCGRWPLGFQAGDLVVSQDPDLFTGQIVRVVTAYKEYVPAGYAPVAPAGRRRTNKDAFACIPVENLYMYGLTAGEIL